MLHLDTMLLESMGLGAKDIVSFIVFNCNPSILTVALQSVVLSMVATCCRAVLLEAHGCKLKPAWCRIFHD